MLVDKSTSVIIGRHVDQHIDQISVSILPVWRWTLGQYGDLQNNVSRISVNCRWYIDQLSYNTMKMLLKKLQT